MLKQRVFKIISQVMNVPLDLVNEQSSSDNLERWDSLQHMNLVLALEEEFKVKFTDDEIVRMLNVDVVLSILSSKAL